MKTFKYLMVAGIMMCLSVACSKNNKNDDLKVPIVLDSKVINTKTTVQDQQIAADQEVGVFVTTTAAPAVAIYDNIQLTAVGDGTFSYAETMFYPLSNENINLYAYQPRQAGAMLASVLNFSVISDQTVLENYLDSDLLFASVTGVARSQDPINLHFYHKLTKLNFTIVEGAGTNLANLSSIQILNVLPSTTLNLTTGSITAATGTGINIQVHNVRGVPAERVDVGDMSAIIVPQQITAGTRLLRITVNGGTPEENNYYYAPDADITFGEGLQYFYNITINHAGITVTSTVENWGNGGIINGEGVLD